ncbi:MAG TPA: alpha-L-arabinofuranosidase C-terminal domain-containing protein [Candidatus Sulfotelmatobacter sp.]|nr:alpha-L-arabinofuranosidase C-terminal domain-containing protein [Candidatus Sulfotelmatobacter sp.]
MTPYSHTAARTVSRLLQQVLLLNCFLCAARAQNAAATLTIDASKVENSISPTLYGQFAEFMFQDIKGGLDAELVRDRGFDEQPNALGLPRYWERDPDDRNDDGGLRFSWDSGVYLPTVGGENTLPSQHSLRVDVHREAPQRRGVHQGWIPVRAGLDYRGYVWLKSADYVGNAVITLEADQTGGEQYASAVLREISGDWKNYSFTLRPVKSDPLAKLAILFEGNGRVWLDQVSLLPGDAQGGVRHDVEQLVAALHPAFIRWPGGNVAQDYHWQWGIGPRDRRPVWINESWAKELEPSNFGTDEFIQFARRVGAEPSITVNVEGRGATAEEAAAWVEYCNGDAHSRYGSIRAANGNPEPFRVRYWEIGNEIWGDWVRGHSDARTYAANLNRYVEKMRAVDPSIKIIATGDNNLSWNETVLKMAGRNIDYLSVHHYYGPAEMKGDADNLRAHPLRYEKFYLQMKQMFQELVPGHDIKLAVNEWNTTLPVPAQHSMQSAVYAARLMNVFERTGDVVQMSAVSDMVNGWSGGIVQASRHAVYVTPTYLVNQLYASHLGAERLASTLSGPAFNSSLEGTDVPTIDAVATRSSDGRRIFIKVVNTDPSHAVSMKVLVNGAHISPEAHLETLNGGGLSVANDFAHPDLVRITESPVNTSPFAVILPEHSVSVITVKVN